MASTINTIFELLRKSNRMQRNQAHRMTLSWTDVLQVGKLMKSTRMVLRPPPSENLCSPSIRACGSWPKRDILIMGTFHPDHAAHNGLVHKLHAATKEDTSRTRNSHFHIRGSVQHPPNCMHKRLIPQRRHAGWLDHTGHTWTGDTGQCQL